jgi:hypothetical protein
MSSKCNTGKTLEIKVTKEAKLEQDTVGARSYLQYGCTNRSTAMFYFWA